MDVPLTRPGIFQVKHHIAIVCRSERQSLLVDIPDATGCSVVTALCRYADGKQCRHRLESRPPTFSIATFV
jgi:hypothetical protein